MSTPIVLSPTHDPTDPIVNWPDEASVAVNKLIETLSITTGGFKIVLEQAQSSNILHSELSDKFNLLRSCLIDHVNQLDHILENLNMVTDKTCIKSCLGLPLPPVKFVDNKSVSTEPPARTPTPVSPASTVTYATIAAGKPPAQTPRPKPKPSARKGPVAVLNPVRLVIRSADPSRRTKPFSSILCHGPSEPFRRLSHAMALSPSTKDVTLLGVHRNRSENLIVSLPHGTPDSAVAAVSTVIHSTFSNPSSARPLPLQITRDVPWAKLMVSSVPARPTSGAPTYSEEEVMSSFSLNPAIKTLSITRTPRWVRNPASITGIHSSFTFSFEDPDGSLARSLAKSRLFMFGEPVHLKRWIDKPLAKRNQPSNQPRLTTADQMEE
ncbi:hypothetical protein FRC09_011132 [Ceratobasidium sp. 395]|nr:hypothetical protein FRC09_011132 [Ceratobasidium sp. 395]